MPQCIAILRQERFSQNQIDDEKGIITGVKIAQLGKVACFAGPDGKPRHATISAAHVDAFLSHAGNRSIPVHWTHDYRQSETDNLHAKVGALKNLRKDESGSPIADLHLSPSQHREAILWNAHNDPDNMMLSPVYGYNPEDKDSVPLSFNACDLVESGASTVALFSDYSEQTKPMEKPEFIALFKDALKDPEIATLLKPQATAAMSETQIAETVKTQVTAALSELKPTLLVEATAAMTAKLGNSNALLNASGGQAGAETPEAFIQAEMASMDKPDRAVAITMMSAKKPKLYNRYVEGK